VFENRVLRKVSELEGFEVTGGWRRVRVEEFHDLY